jgi:hypothetical protein
VLLSSWCWCQLLFDRKLPMLLLLLLLLLMGCCATSSNHICL